MKSDSKKISEVLVDDFVSYFFNRFMLCIDQQDITSKEVIPEEIAKYSLKEIRKFLNKEELQDLLTAKIELRVKKEKC